MCDIIHECSLEHKVSTIKVWFKLTNNFNPEFKFETKKNSCGQFKNDVTQIPQSSALSLWHAIYPLSLALDKFVTKLPPAFPYKCDVIFECHKSLPNGQSNSRDLKKRMSSVLRSWEFVRSSNGLLFRCPVPW